jgi:60kDa lysophospholipase
MGEARNDGLNNLLCALTIAGHYHIPEVIVVFDNYILRGNRTTKSSVSSFKAFTSPNYYPLGKLGLKIQIQWELIQSCKPDKPTKFTKLNPKATVGLIKLTPFSLPV